MTKQQAIQLVMFYGPETVALFRPFIPLSDEEIEEALKRRPYVRDLYTLPANLAMADDMQTVRGAEVFAQSLQEQQPSQPQPQPPSTPTVDVPQPTAPAQPAASQQRQPDVGVGDIVIGDTVFEFAGFGPPMAATRGGGGRTYKSSTKESNPYEEIATMSSFLGGYGGSLAASASLTGQLESLQNDFAQIHDALMAQAGVLKSMQQQGVDVAASLKKIKDKAERFLELEVQTTEKLQNLLALRLVYEASTKDPIVRETSIDYALDVLAVSEAKTGLLTPIGNRVVYVRPGPREAQVNIENALLGVFLDNNASEVGQAEVESQLYQLATKYAKDKSPEQVVAGWRANPASAPEAARRILESPVGSVVMEDLANIALDNVRSKAPTMPVEKEIFRNGLVYAADRVAHQMAAVIDGIVKNANKQDAPEQAAQVLSRIGNVVEVVNSLRRQRNRPPIFLNAEQAVAYMLSATGAYERADVEEKTRQFLAIAARAKPVVGPPRLPELLKMPKRKVTVQDVKKAYDAHVQKNRDYWRRVVGEAVQSISAAFIGLPNATALRKAAYTRWRERSTGKVGLSSIDKLFGIQYRRALSPSTSPRPAKSTSKSSGSGRGVSSSTRPLL